VVCRCSTIMMIRSEDNFRMEIRELDVRGG